MVEVEAKIDTARLSQVLDELQIETGRDLFQSTMYAVNRIAQSGRADSKPGMKQREMVRNPMFGLKKSQRSLFDLSDEKQGRFARYRYMIAIDTQKRGRRWWHTNDQNDAKRTKPRYALASKIWDVLAAKAAATKSPSSVGGEWWFVGSSAKLPDSVSATMENQLTYLTDAFPNQAARIVDKALDGIQHQLGTLVRDTCDKVSSRG